MLGFWGFPDSMEEPIPVCSSYRHALLSADMGTKALPVGQFVLYRDVMNGYALVKAAYPNKTMSPLVFQGYATYVTSAFVKMQAVVNEMGVDLTDVNL